MTKTKLRLLLLVFLMILGTSVASLALFFRSNVEILYSHYPVFNSQTKSYELVAKKPSHWVGLGQVSKLAKWAIVLSEDWAFYGHEGVDFNQLKIVLEESWKEKRLIRGASTISQQVVKNALLSQERSLWRKFREIILTYKMERILSKDRILEIYLNMVELGDGVYGIKQAANFYFRKHPAQLTAREGAFLAMLLPSPKKYSVSFRRKELTVFATQQMERVLLKLRQARIYSEEDRLQALQERFWWEPQPIMVESTEL